MTALRYPPCRLNAALLLAAALLPCVACKPAAHGVFLSMEVPALTFIKSQDGGSVEGSRIYSFPALEVFDKSGHLVYRSHDGSRNAALLRSLPQSIENAGAVSDPTSLAETLRLLSPLREIDRRTLLDSHLPVVIAFSLKECDACTLQESALTPDQARNVAARGINIVIVRVMT